jgi:parallel beta-helix repeat protein
MTHADNLAEIWKATVNTYIESLASSYEAKLDELRIQLEKANGDVTYLNAQIVKLKTEADDLRRQLEANYDEVIDNDIQALLDAKAVGAVIKLPPREYRISEPLAPKSGQKIFATGSTFKGSRVVGTWVNTTYTDAAGAQRGAFYATGLLPPVYSDAGVCEIIEGEEANGCRQLEDVFLNGARLERVMQLKNLKAGKVYADYATNRVYIFDIPNNVEISTTRFFMNTMADGVRLSGAKVMHFASPSQKGALTVSGFDWEVDNCTFLNNHSSGLHITGADNANIHDNFFEGNGQAGMTHHKSHNTKVVNNTFRGNNTAGYYKRDWESAGLKVTYSNNTLIQFNTVEANNGVGIWLDIDNRGYKVLDNRIVDNFSCGVRLEISFGGEVRRNKLFRNGFGHAGPGRGSDYSAFATAAIHVNSTGGMGTETVEITDNFVGIDILADGRVVSLPNQNAIHLEERYRGLSKTYPSVTWTLRNVKVRNNHVNLTQAAAGYGTGVAGIGVLNGTSKAAYELATGNRFEGNHYYSPDQALQSFHVYDTAINQYRDYLGWQRKGWDKPETGSTFTKLTSAS